MQLKTSKGMPYKNDTLPPKEVSKKSLYKLLGKSF